MTTRQEVERLAQDAKKKAIVAGENGQLEKARRLFAAAEQLRQHAKTLGVDAPLGAAYLPNTSPGVGAWAAPNGEEQL